MKKLTYNDYMDRWTERYENGRIPSEKVPMSINVWETKKNALKRTKKELNDLKVEDTAEYWNNYNKLVLQIAELEMKLEGWEE